MIPAAKRCRRCGETFWVGCLDGKQKRCRPCQLELRIEKLRAALERLASSEAFVFSRPTNEEDVARMGYAQKALEEDQ
jgi:hypothetical protein